MQAALHTFGDIVAVLDDQSRHQTAYTLCEHRRPRPEAKSFEHPGWPDMLCDWNVRRMVVANHPAY